MYYKDVSEKDGGRVKEGVLAGSDARGAQGTEAGPGGREGLPLSKAGLESRLPFVVRSTEIDINGHVNNAKYLEYLEWGREDFYEKAGLAYEVLKSLGAITVTVNLNINYRREARQNDRMTVVTRPLRVGRTSFTLAQEIVRDSDGATVSDATATLVTVDPATRRSVPVPDPVRALF